MNSRSLLFSAALTLGCFQLSAQWSELSSTPITASSAAYTQLVRDNSNNYYLSYSIGTNGGFVQKFNGTSWSQLGTGAATPGSASYGNIGVNEAGEVFYAYQDGANSSNLSVRKYDPMTATWSNLGVAISGAVVNYQTLKVNPSTGLPVVSYNQSGIRVKRYDGTAWQSVGAQPIATGNGLNHAVVIGNNDTVYATFLIGSSYSVYKSYINAPDGTAWQLVGTAGFTSGGSSNQFNVSLAIDNSNHLYLAYRGPSANGGKIAVKKYDGSTWYDLGTPFFSAGDVEHISIAVSNNTPYVSYRDNSTGKTVVQYYNETTWTSLGNASTNYGNYNALIVNNTGIPVIAFGEGASAGSGVPTVKSYVGTVLPIALDKLTAINKGSANILSWNTLSEASSDQFLIERSQDGIVFTAIGKQRANGAASNYQFSDESPFTGKSYYRLQLKENTGKTTYSAVVSATLTSGNSSLKCYPNPAGEYLNVDIPSTKVEMILSLTDLSGRSIYTQKISGSGAPRAVRVNLTEVATGTYLLRLVGNGIQMQQKVTRD